MGNRSLIASLVTLALGLAPAAGHTAGLGRLTILSAIGQPLVGEIDLVSVRREEVSTLAARIAAPDAYKNAGINYNGALVGARASVEKRPNGNLYLKVTSTRPVEEPYLDLLIELTWNTGRLVREYTALVDPPGFGPTQTAAPVVVPDSKPAAAAPAAPAARAAAAPAASTASAPSGQTYGPVQSGDTLRKIAAGVKPQGVSLDQMLVAIFRSNPDAFINNNMNLLRTGRVLKIPDANELAAVTPVEADKEIRLQASDWNSYRQRAAGAAPEVPSADARSAAGKIATKVDDPGAAPAPSKEVVKVSKGAPGKPGAGGDKEMQERIRSLEEEATAREKTLKDSSDRIASLEKTIKDMQRLLELKGVAVPPGSKPTAESKPVAEAPVAAAPKADPAPEAAKSETKPVAEAPPQPKIEPAPPAEKAPVEPPKAEKKAAPVPPPPPAEDPWWMDPAVLGGGLLALGVLGGGAYAVSRRKKQQAAASGAPEVEPTLRVPKPAAEPSPAASSTGAFTPAMAGATMQMPAMPEVVASPAAVDDVDPIAEADVYIAYGRDAQAEEILKEALSRDPTRDEVKLKLLEIYAARKSKSDFNPLASQINASTGGSGDTWLRVATMGYALDPENAMYAAGKDSSIHAPVGAVTDVNLDFDLDMVSSAGAPTTVTDVPLDAGDQNVKTMILSPETMDALKAETAALAAKAGQNSNIVPDLDLSTTAMQAPNTDVTLQPAVPSPTTDINLDLPAPAGTDSNVIDFEFDPGKTMKIEPEAAAAFMPEQTVAITPENQEIARDLGIEIDLGALDVPAAQVQGDAVEPTPVAEPTLDINFDFQLPSDTPAEQAAAVADRDAATASVPPTDIKLEVPEITLDIPDLKPADTATMDFALETVSLDLGDAKPADGAAAAVSHDDHWYDVQTKFDLAKAYQEMGDKDGAREILQEVIREGDPQQQKEATELMAKLG